MNFKYLKMLGLLMIGFWMGIWLVKILVISSEKIEPCWKITAPEAEVALQCLFKGRGF